MSKNTEKTVRSMLSGSGKINLIKFDALVSARIDELDLERRALKKLGNAQLDGVNPIRIDGYEYGKNAPCYIGMGKNGEIRTSNYLANIFYFGKVQLYTYSYMLSLAGDYREERLSEIYYKDICGFVTENKYQEFKDISGKKFELPDRNLSILLKGEKLNYNLNCELIDITEQNILDLKSIVQAKIYKSF